MKKILTITLMATLLTWQHAAHAMQQFCYECRDGSKTSVEQMLNTNPNLEHDLDRGDRFDMTPLIHAICGQNQDIITHLLERGANPDIADTNDNAPLHHAIGSKNPVSVATLIFYGADINARNNTGETPRAAVEYHLNQWKQLPRKRRRITPKEPVEDIKNMLCSASSIFFENADTTFLPVCETRLCKQLNFNPAQEPLDDSAWYAGGDDPFELDRTILEDNKEIVRECIDDIIALKQTDEKEYQSATNVLRCIMSKPLYRQLAIIKRMSDHLDRVVAPNIQEHILSYLPLHQRLIAKEVSRDFLSELFQRRIDKQSGVTEVTDQPAPKTTHTQ